MPEPQFITNSIFEGEPLPFAAEGLAAGKQDDQLSTQYKQWQAQDTPQTRHAVLKTMQPVLDRTVSMYGNHPYMAGQAKKLALEALHTYDPAKGKLQTHVQAQLRGLQRLAAQQDQIISIPERIMLDRRDLLNSETELEDRLGRPPNMSELANHTGLSQKRIGYIRGTVPAIAAGSIRGEGGEPIDPATQSLRKDTGPSLWEKMVYEDLSPTDKFIYDYTLGTNGTKKLSGSQLAEKLGISAAAVSQRKAVIQQQIDQGTQEGMY